MKNTEEDMPNFIKYYFRHFLNYEVKNYTKDFCGAGTDIFMFSENKLVPCNRFKDSPELIEKIPSYHKMSVCQTCEVKNYCEKGCLFEQIKNEGPIKELCDIYKFMYRNVSQMTKKLKDDLNFKSVVMKEITDG